MNLFIPFRLKYRSQETVKVIEELYVSIEEFDYELKENGCLQLLADISITGLCDEERIEDEEEDRVC